MLQLLESENELLLQLARYATGEVDLFEGKIPRKIDPQLRKVLRKTVLERGATMSLLLSNNFDPNEIVNDYESDSESDLSSDEEVLLEGDEYTNLDYYFSGKPDPVIQEIMTLAGNHNMNCDQFSMLLSQLVPIYRQLGSVALYPPRQMGNKAYAAYTLRTAQEEAYVGPYVLRRMIEQNLISAKISAVPGRDPTITIGDKEFVWYGNNVKFSDTEGINKALAGTKYKGKTPKFFTCPFLGDAHAAFVNAVSIVKPKGSSNYRIFQRPTQATSYSLVKTLKCYPLLIDALQMQIEGLKSADEVHNTIQMFLYNEYAAMAKELFAACPKIIEAAQKAAERVLTTLPPQASICPSLTMMAARVREIEASKKTGRNAGINGEVFRSNASRYNRCPNIVAEYATFAPIADYLVSQKIARVVVGTENAPADRNNLLHDALTSKGVVASNWDNVTRKFTSLASAELKDSALILNTTDQIMSSAKITHPKFLDNIIHAAAQGPAVIISRWKTSSFVKHPESLLQEWGSKVPDEYHNLSFIKSGKFHTTHFFLVLVRKVQIPQEGVKKHSFTSIVLALTKRVVEIAWVMESYTQAACGFGSAPRFEPVFQYIMNHFVESQATMKKFSWKSGRLFALHAGEVNLEVSIGNAEGAAPIEEIEGAIMPGDVHALKDEILELEGEARSTEALHDALEEFAKFDSESEHSNVPMKPKIPRVIGRVEVERKFPAPRVPEKKEAKQEKRKRKLPPLKMSNNSKSASVPSPSKAGLGTGCAPPPDPPIEEVFND
jgi:hypothetical protein